jgi:hypothetical protein
MKNFLGAAARSALAEEVTVGFENEELGDALCQPIDFALDQRQILPVLGAKSPSSCISWTIVLMELSGFLML